MVFVIDKSQYVKIFPLESFNCWSDQTNLKQRPQFQIWLVQKITVHAQKIYSRKLFRIFVMSVNVTAKQTHGLKNSLPAVDFFRNQKAYRSV